MNCLQTRKAKLIKISQVSSYRRSKKKKKTPTKTRYWTGNTGEV
jgi:hypothetical protein